MISNQPSGVDKIWHGAKVKSKFEKEVLILVTRLEFLKPKHVRRTAFQLRLEAKELMKINSKQKLMNKIQELKC